MCSRKLGRAVIKLLIQGTDELRRCVRCGRHWTFCAEGMEAEIFNDFFRMIVLGNVPYLGLTRTLAD